MEYIVLASTPGIATQGLLDLFSSPGSETLFVAFTTLHEAKLITASAQATRIVFHGEYHAELIKRIHAAYPVTKNILLFDTAETALLGEFARTPLSLDNCINHWLDCISQMTLFAEQNAHCSALVDYASLSTETGQILTLLNQRLGIQFTNCTVNATNYSGIARLIAAAALIDRDETMAFYDDAKTLALTSHNNTTNYIDVNLLIAKQHSVALNEFQTLLKYLQNDVAMENLALAFGQKLEDLANTREQLRKKESELAIALLQIQQLQEELGITQLAANQLCEENTRQQLSSKQNELEIALLQINQLQEELEDTLVKYNAIESRFASNALIEKVLGELPLLGLLRNRANPPTQIN